MVIADSNRNNSKNKSEKKTIIIGAPITAMANVSSEHYF